jgi:CRP/FNR family nitrogen fixation transcriptional regulator
MVQAARATLERSPTLLVVPRRSPETPKISNISEVGRTELFRMRTTVYSQEDPADFFYHVNLGVVCTARLTSDGRRVVRDFHLPGEIFGIESSPSYTCSAEAVCDTYLVRFNRVRLEALINTGGATGHVLLSSILLDSERIAKRLFLLGRGSAIERLAYFLLDLAERYSAGIRLELPMTRTDIGDSLGLSNETVSRTFTTLREQGLISIEGHTVTLLNMRTLRVLAGD